MIRTATLLVCLALPACASIATGVYDEVRVTNGPDGPPRSFVVTGPSGVLHRGVTPDTFTARRGSAITVQAGTGEWVLNSKRGVNHVTWGNIVLGGAIGLAVDMGTGAIYNFRPTLDLSTESGYPE